METMNNNPAKKSLAESLAGMDGIHFSELLQEVGGDNDFLYCREVPEVILLATCWIIATTVILNGSTMKFVMGLVGLTEKSQASRALHAPTTSK